MTEHTFTVFLLVDMEGNHVAHEDESAAVDRWNDDVGGAWDRMVRLTVSVQLTEPVTLTVPGGSVSASAE